MCVALALPTRAPQIVGGRAAPLLLEHEPGEKHHGHYLLLTASVRRLTFAELIWRHVSHVAATPTPGSMDESREMAWSAVRDIVGSVLHVDAVAPGSPAETAGIEAGDQVISVNGHDATEVEIDTALAGARPLRLRIQRHTDVVDLELVALPPWPQPQAGGMTLRRGPITGPAPAVDTGSASGSSGGLVLALAELDLLTPGDLTGGTTVAATGELGPGGFVGPVLGYDVKVRAALDAGATAVLVPPEAADHVRSLVPPGVRVFGVQRVSEAMWDLCGFGGTSSVCGNATSPAEGSGP
jgi:PDZ domain-containing secreted protein